MVCISIGLFRFTIQTLRAVKKRFLPDNYVADSFQKSFHPVTIPEANIDQLFGCPRKHHRFKSD